MSVSAKDKGTNKEQKITIQASGGLSDDDIDAMVREAEENAEADKERRGLVEAKNQAEGLIHGTQKSVEEHGDKVDDATKAAIEDAVEDLKEAVETDELEKIKEKTQSLTEVAMKLGEAIYKSEAEANEGGEDEPSGVDEDIVDADFEDLGEDDRKA